MLKVAQLLIGRPSTSTRMFCLPSTVFLPIVTCLLFFFFLTYHFADVEEQGDIIKTGLEQKVKI